MRRRDFLRTAGGATAVGVAGTSAAPVAAQEDGGGGSSTTVDMTDGLKFEPSSITIPPGTTVVWENVGSVGHTVTAYEDEIPGDAEYFASGGFDGEQAARDGYPDQGDIPGGESYEHTFDVTGTYEYFCIPHETAGMTGTVVVEEGATLGGGGGEGGGGGGEKEPEEMGVPIRAHYVGAGAILATAITLVFTFFQLKYGESPHASGGGN